MFPIRQKHQVTISWRKLDVVGYESPILASEPNSLVFFETLFATSGSFLCIHISFNTVLVTVLLGLD